jgi:hypothetical protein
MILRFQSAIAVLMCSCLIGAASPTSSSIGLVMTTGAVQVDGLEVRNTSAIFAGNLVESKERSANLQFSDGTGAVMRPGAKMTVYGEHSVLEHGIAMQRGIDKHPVLADGLKVSGATSDAVALVGVRDGSYVEVAAQQGESEVWDSSGELVAKVEPGKTLGFAIAQAAAGTQVENLNICGDLTPEYLITDHARYVTYRLQGGDLQRYVGKEVRVTGTVSGATSSPSGAEILIVSTIKKLNRVCEAAPAWNTKTIITVTVVAVGASLIGLAASGAFSSSQPAVTPTTP